jgi:hypothetical protein
MWGSLLVLALLIALNPVRLGLIVLVISRPRPVQNLLAYWVGGLIVSVHNILVPLLVLHFTPMFRSFAKELATPATTASSTVGYIQIGVGAAALSIAALIAVRFSARRRARLPTPGGNTSTLVLDPNTPPVISRLLGRVRNAWENGSLWVAFVIGLLSGPGAEEILFVLAIILASGAAIGTQVSAALASVVVMLAVVEIFLIGYLAKPAKTQALLRRLHDWARIHRRNVLVAMFGVVGVALVVQGMASF